MDYYDMERVLDEVFSSVTPKYVTRPQLPQNLPPEAQEIVDKLRIGWTVHEIARHTNTPKHKIYNTLRRAGVSPRAYK